MGAARIGKIDYKIIEGKFGGYYYSRAENGIRVEKGGAGIGGKWSRDKALQEAMEDGPLAREVAPQHMPAYDLGYQRKPLPEGINNAEQAASDRGANDRMNADRAAANPRAELSAVQAKLPPGYTARDLGGFTWLRIDGPNGYGLETNSVEDALKEVRKHARPRTPQAPPMPGMTPLGAKPKPSKSEADEAMAKLTKLFGKNRKPGLSAPEDVLAETDDAVYADAKPPFIAAAEKFAEHKNNVGALVSAMVGELRSTHDWDRDMLEEAKPYFRRFINDVKTGVIDLAAGPKAPNLKEGGSSDEHPGTQGAGTKTLGGVAPGEGGCGRRGNWTRLSTGRQGRPRSRSTT